MTLLLHSATVLTPTEIFTEGAVVVGETGQIVYVGPEADAPPVAGPRLNLRGRNIAPGFIDVHTHGGRGFTFGRALDNLENNLRAYSAWVATTGVTGFLCTLATPDQASLVAQVRAYADLLETGDFPGARPLGLHLEGPYLSPEKKGAFNARWLREPSVDEVHEVLEAGRGWIRQMTLAPELPHAAEIAALLRASGVVAALGHTNIDYATASAALRGNFTHVTHTFNAQRGFHHREPGVVGAVFASDHVTAELIADTIHAHPGAMRVLVRCLGPERIALITDAMAAAGLGDGEYNLVGHPVFVKDGVAREADGTIAGSTVTLDRCVQNMIRAVGVSLPDAVKMATLTPARAMGLEAQHGQLRVGRAADLVVLDAAAHVQLTLVQGRIIHKAF